MAVLIHDRMTVTGTCRVLRCRCANG